MNIKQSIIDWTKAHEREYLADLKELIAIDSARADALPGMPYGKNCADVLAKGQEILSKYGFDSLNDDNYVITADLNDKETELGILAHLDIVPTGDGWKKPPLEMREDETKIYGRGTADDKGPALAAFYAMRCLKELGVELNKNCKIILGADEECGSSDIRHYFSHNPVPPKTLSPDADYPVINIEKGGLHADATGKWDKEDVLPRIAYVDAGIKFNMVPATAKAKVLGMTADQMSKYMTVAAEKTRCKFNAITEGDGVILTAEGVNAHASTPYEGNNALTALNEMLALLPIQGKSADVLRGLVKLFPHNDFYGVGAGVAHEDKESGKLTMSFDIFKMDETGCSVTADCRAALCATDATLTDVMRAAFADIGLVMADNRMYAPHYVPEDSELVQELLKTYEEYTGTKGECIAIGGGTYVHHLEGGVSFGAAFPGTNNNMHAPDEYAVKEHLYKTIQMYAQVVYDLCK